LHFDISKNRNEGINHGKEKSDANPMPERTAAISDYKTRNGAIKLGKENPGWCPSNT
jgi:hypothetical protein